jgi:hypothetical protein
MMDSGSFFSLSFQSVTSPPRQLRDSSYPRRSATSLAPRSSAARSSSSSGDAPPRSPTVWVGISRSRRRTWLPHLGPGGRALPKIGKHRADPSEKTRRGPRSSASFPFELRHGPFELRHGISGTTPWAPACFEPRRHLPMHAWQEEEGRG